MKMRKNLFILLLPMLTCGYNLLPKQKKFQSLILDKNIPIVFGIGPAGTGKTMISCKEGVELLKMNTYKKIIITRPVVSVDEEIGFLPGSLNEKMAPWMSPLYDYFNENESTTVNKLLSSQKIEIVPMAFMRGRTFNNAYIIGDEMQNSTPMQMKTLLTRIGRDSKLVITGDLEQSDLGTNNGLTDIMLLLSGKYKYEKEDMFRDGIGVVTFDNACILRNPVVKSIIDLYRANDII
jgi:phosphate starvation-inducible protein PhoH and related proteins